MKRTKTLMQIFAILAMFTFSLNAQKTSQDINDKVVLQIGKEDITWGKLDKAFNKNMNKIHSSLLSASQDSILTFIDLYTNYRLKVLDALDRGFHLDSSIQHDLVQNRKLLAENHFFDKMLTEPAIEQWTKRSNDEVKFAFILIPDKPIDENDTIAPLIKAKNILNQIMAGASFAEMAEKHSFDKESGKNGGILPSYVTAGRIQRELEDALYSLKPGEVYPEIVRTDYGYYFVLKLIDRAKREFAQVKHILISNKYDDTLGIASLAKADSLYKLIKAGASFEELAKMNSDDDNTASLGGLIDDYYSRSSGLQKSGQRLDPSFEETMFSLNHGEVSTPVATLYGYHLVKRIGTGQPDYKAEKDELKMLYKRLYFDKDKEKLMDKLAEEQKFHINVKNFDELVSYLDTNRTNLDSTWAKKIPNSILNKTLFELHPKLWTVSDFIMESNTNSNLRGSALSPNGVKVAIKKIIQPLVFDKATENLEQRYPEFADLMNEFRDGILLFKAEDQEVWSKLKFDSLAAKSYWEETKDNYKMPVRYNVIEIFVMSDSAAKEIYAKAQAGENFEDLARNLTQRAGYREKSGNWGLLDIKTHKLTRNLDHTNLKSGSIIEPFAIDNGFSVLKINKIEQERTKTFSEAISDFAPKFQEVQQKKLLNAWLERIKTKHQVKRNEKEITAILKSVGK